MANLKHNDFTHQCFTSIFLYYIIIIIEYEESYFYMLDGVYAGVHVNYI
jgi:hypothetical protein